MLSVLCGDAIEQLRTLPDESVQCCVTSPPYWGLRSYGVEGQYGLEESPEEYVRKMVAVFREVRRVLRKDGTCWVNLGDTYNQNTGKGFNGNAKRPECARETKMVQPDGLPAKNLIGIPWRVAFALQADGWWLRSDIIWAKPNPMPESVTDRPTKSHEYLFLLTKNASYFYDAEAIKEKNSEGSIARFGLGENGQTRAWNTDNNKRDGRTDGTKSNEAFRDHVPVNRNKRSVWMVATAPYPEAHFATYPPDLVKPCIMAGTSAKGCCAKCGAPWERVVDKGERVWDETENARPTAGFNKSVDADDNYKSANFWKSGYRPNMHYENKTLGWQPTCPHADAPVVPCTILDPFAGSGTSGAVALELGRKAILIELNPKYVELIEQRCTTTYGLALAC